MPETGKMSAYLYVTLDHALAIGGKTIPAGTEVMVLPHAAAHVHTDAEALLSEYQTQLIRYTDRQTKLETWAAANGYTGA